MEEIRDRIKTVRETLALSQAAFGDSLSLERSAISLIERKQRNVTERCVKDICREFNVDYIWLTTGEGEMFSENDSQALELIDRVLSGENEFAKRVFKAFASFDESDWKTLKKFIESVAAEEKDEKKEAD